MRILNPTAVLAAKRKGFWHNSLLLSLSLFLLPFSSVYAQSVSSPMSSSHPSGHVYGPQPRSDEDPIPGEILLGLDSTFTQTGDPRFVPEVNEKVLRWVDYFTGTGRKTFERWLIRSGRYMNLMGDILAEEGLPPDLAALVFVESGFNVHARSWAHAVGPWQFIRGTARLFDLTINSWVDERRDPVKSTVAAAKYLKHLYELFQSWPLALASYNSGEGTVISAMRRHGSSDFWSLKLPRQTEEYVPQFMAALILSKNPSRYGFDVQYEPPLEFDEITVAGLVDLKAIAAMCQVPLETIKALNPGLLRHRTPPTVFGVMVRVPAGMGEISLEKLSSLPPSPPVPENPTARATTYMVKKGDTLSGISEKFGVSLSALRRTNGLKDTSRILAGHVLSIPGKGIETVPEKKPGAGSEDAKVYRVRRGDTLYGLAKEFGVSFSELLKVNEFSAKRRLRTGERILVPNRRDVSRMGTHQEVASANQRFSAPAAE